LEACERMLKASKLWESNMQWLPNMLPTSCSAYICTERIFTRFCASASLVLYTFFLLISLCIYNYVAR
jgi:hypothetical protein